MDVCNQEANLNYYFDIMTDLLIEIANMENSINVRIRPIVKNALDLFYTHLNPGLTTLTWSTVNIDSFLFRTRSSLKTLHELMAHVNNILHDRIDEPLCTIACSPLFDLPDDVVCSHDDVVSWLHQSVCAQVRVDVCIYTMYRWTICQHKAQV